MAWSDYGVSRRLRLTNGVVPFVAGGIPLNTPIQQTAILETLRLIIGGTTTITLGGGTIARDALGPWNQVTNITVSPNQQAPIFQTSGFGAALINQLISIEKQPNTPDTTIVSATSTAPAADIYNFPTTSGTFRYPLTIPVAQRIRSLGGLVGYWPLQNPAVQLGVQVTLNSASNTAPFNQYSLTAGQAPYLTTGAATATLASGSGIEIIRNMWEVPTDPANLPPFNLVSTWIEEAPQGASVNGATAFQWQATPLIGLLVRLGVYIYDGTTNQGIASNLLTPSNSLALTYDADTPKFLESSFAALARQRDYYGFDLEQGFFAWDLLGSDQTLQDVIDTNTTANIKLKVSLSSALGASNSFAKILRQVIAPLEIR